MGLPRDEYDVIADMKGLHAPRVTKEHIASLIVREQFHAFPGTTTTVCLLTLKNDFSVVGTSACASPENFDPGLGERIARDKAVDKIWQLEGYLLCERLSYGDKS